MYRYTGKDGISNHPLLTDWIECMWQRLLQTHIPLAVLQEKRQFMFLVAGKISG